MNNSAIQTEVDRNYEAFQKLLPELIAEHNGRFALMRGEKVEQIFDSVHDAVVFAKDKYDDDLFSVQEITERIVDMGFFSHAIRRVVSQYDGKQSFRANDFKTTHRFILHHTLIFSIRLHAYQADWDEVYAEVALWDK